MADLILRDYQIRLVDDIVEAWADVRSVIAWLPTGGGKTELSICFAKSEESRRGRTLFVVDRKTLAAQAQARYEDKYGLRTGLIRGEATRMQGTEPALVASIQTLKARWDRPEIQAVLSRVTLIVIDEAHISFKHHKELLDHLPNARVLGLTATPLRDGLGLTYQKLVRGPSYEDLIQAGHLVRPRYFLPSTSVAEGLQRTKVSTTGDYVTRELSELMRQKAIIGRHSCRAH